MPGIATVRLSFEGWPDGAVRPSVFKIPVVPRKATYAVSVSPRQHAVWRLPEGWQVRQVSVTPNGRDVAVVSRRRDKSGDTYRLSLCEFPTGRVRHVLLDLPPEKGFSHWIYSLAFSPDGRWLAVSHLRQGGTEKNAQRDEVYISAGRLFLIDLTNGEVIHRMQTDGFSVYGLAFTPDGTKLATTQSSRTDRRKGERFEPEFNGDVRIWNVASGKLLTTFRADRGQGPSHVAFAPDGKSLAVSYWIASPDRTADTFVVKVLDFRDGRLRATLPDRDEPQFFPDSRSLLARGIKGNLVLHDLDNQRDQVVLTFASPNRWARHWRLAADGRSAFCFLNDGQIVSVELPSGKVLAEKQAPAGRDPKRRYSCTAQSRDGHLFAAGEHTEPPQHMSGAQPEDWEEVPPSEIHVWDTRQLRPLATLTGHVGRINDIDFSPDGHWLLSGGIDGTVRLWDLSDLAPSSLAPTANVRQN
jgi:WD40 repeat protein